MRYLIVAEAYRDLEQVSSRLALTERLAALLAETPAALLPTVCYLCQGLIAPEFAGVDLGLAEKLAVRALAIAGGTDTARVAGLVREAGDLGQAAERLLALPVARAAGGAAGLQVTEVVRTLREIAVTEGAGSQGRKLELLAGLLGRATPLEARYLLRLVTRNLRLGIGTPTILDALAQVHAGGKAARPVLERGYSICCDLGKVAATLVSGGLAAVEQLRVEPGNPVRVMLAQRLSDADQILARLGGRCAAEYKYDGIRVQAHRTADGTVELFTRRLEEISGQFPDVVQLLAGVGPAEVILEGEVVAFDAAAGELRPFGEVMLRRRKHGIDQAVRDVPVGLFCFELLYADGQDLTMLPYPQRRAALAAALTPSPRLRLTTAAEITDPSALDEMFAQAVTDGCEGLVCKSTGPDSAYQAGARGWQWIKLKRDYRTELSDTADLAVIGAFAGRGRRTGVYGAVLLAAYDSDAGVFRAVTKCGAGFTDADLAALPARLAPLASPDKPARVDARQEPDVWFEPGLVLEILSAELTLSPNYTAAWGQIQDDAGLAMRFPRFTGRWRDDKSPEDATTTRELAELFLTARRTPTGG
ncbi:MAG TPA: ATP-dependent DNA ligase [Streptosporangiaceae bacterium]|nr:ATP-dependent DNA ligase [Streptosporangiaceae bacterium]